MTYVITTRRGNGKPSVLNTPGLDEATARSMCKALAENGMDKVTLHSLSDVGVIEVMASWAAGGKRARSINGAKATVRTTTVTPEQIEDADTAGLENQDPADAIEMPEDAHDDEAHTYEGYCVKCKTKRSFYGEVTETANGRAMAKGTCPICGTNVNRLLGKAELPDDWHDEHSNAKESVTVEVSDGEAEVTVEGEPGIGDVAEAVEEAAEVAVEAPEFSDEDKAAIQSTATVLNKTAKELLSEKAKPAAKKAQPKATAATTPRKRTSKKTEPAQQELPDEVKEMQQVSTCPQCGRKQPVQEKAGLAIFMTHSAPGLDRCPGSLTVIN